jgi:hypothetical protein
MSGAGSPIGPAQPWHPGYEQHWHKRITLMGT